MVELLVGQEDKSPITGGEVLYSLKAKHNYVAVLQRADAAALPLRANGVRGVLDHLQSSGF